MARKLPQILTEEEFNSILAITKKNHHKLAFKLGFICGLRVSEIIKLEQRDVDYNRRLLFIRQAKGSKDRYVPFPPQFARGLKGVPIKCGIRALQLKFKEKVLQANIQKDLHFHSLRHSCATNYLNKGMDIVQVQQLLGHSRIDTTSIYLHVSPDQVKDKIDEIWK